MANDSNATEVVVSITGNTAGLDAAVAAAEAELVGLGNTNVANNSVKNLKTQLREATQEAQRLQLAGQENTEEYRRAVMQIAELRDQQDVLNRTVAAFDPGNKFNAFIGIAKSAATAVQGYTGALSFIGVEGDNAAETLAKLQGIMAFTDALNGIGDLQDYYKGFVATIKSSVGPINASTLASKGLGLALKSLGIGLIVAAIAYLVTNFQDLKEEFSGLFPAAKDLGKTFDNLKQIFFGVGNAVLQFIIAPIKAVINIINGEFKKAIDDLKKGVDVVNNFETGAAKERGKQAEQAIQDAAKRQLSAAEHRLKLLRSGSKEYADEENRIADLRITAASNKEEQLKAIQDREVLNTSRRNKQLDEADKKREEASKAAADRAKAAAEKAAQERKAGLEEFNRIETEAARTIREASQSARDRELNRIADDYRKRLDLAVKFGQDITKITEAQKTEEAAINKKYDDQILDALESRTEKEKSQYTQKQNDINKFFDDLLKNATAKEIELIEIRRRAELDLLSREDNLSTIALQAQVNLTTVQGNNAPREKDTPQQAFERIKLIGAAELEAENANYELKKAQMIAQNQDIQLLNAEHNARLTEIETQQADASIELRKRRSKAEQDALATGADALENFGALAGEQTVAGKVLSVAAATIATYLAAVQSYASASAIPVYGYIAGPIAAAGAIAAGLANVRKILAVQVPGKTSGGSAAGLGGAQASAANVTAPIVSAAAAQGQQDVRVVNPEDQIVRAYVVDQDLQDAQDKATFLNVLSEF